MTPEQLLVLRGELNADPQSLGYAPFVDSLNDFELMGLLNNISLGGTIIRTDVPSAQAVAFLGASDIVGLTPAQIGHLQLMACTGTLILAAPEPTGHVAGLQPTPLMGALMEYFPDNTVAGQLLRQLANRPASRAEALFGPGVTVGLGDIAIALSNQDLGVQP